MNYIFHPKVIFRAPLRPLKTTFSLEELKILFSEKEIQEAIFLSSPTLLDTFNKWSSNNLISEKDEERLIFSLLKYAIRLHTRCTPFGLFAGCGIAKFSDKNSIIVNTNKRSTRLDMNFTCELSQKLSQKQFIQPFLKYYPNTSIYQHHDKIRYIEYYYKMKLRIHQVCAVDNSSYLQQILQTAKNGATILELAKSILDHEILLEEALEFVEEIVNVQLLVSELEPAVSGDELLSQTIKILVNINNVNPCNELSDTIKLLNGITHQLLDVDSIIGNDISNYTCIEKQIQQLKVPYELNKLFQTDLFIDSSHLKKLDTIVQQQLTTAIKTLNKLTQNPTKTNLSDFKERFYHRYEDKEVPLLLALDPETGIGYAKNTNKTGNVTPLIDNLIFPDNNLTDENIEWNKIYSFLFGKLQNAQKNNHYTIFLKSNDIAEFTENWNDLPDSFSVMYKHHGRKNGKDILSIDSAGGSSGTFLLSRFASGNEEIKEFIKEISNTEKLQNPDALLAEIIHLPENRTGNVLMRPVFRDYEIPYLSKSTLPLEQQITIDDLYISIKEDQIYLRSKRLNKRIVPRLGNAHNYSFNSLPIYHFLCDMQVQNKRGGLYFDWGEIKKEFIFLPRVEIENVIISRATWQLKKEDYRFLCVKEENVFLQLKKLQKKWNIPDLILLAQDDNELLINLNDNLSIKMFLSILNKKNSIILKEFLFENSSSIIKDELGNSYTNEFVTILQRKQINNFSESAGTDVNNQEYFNYDIMKNITRTFSLGSEWLYYKIYSGLKTADEILTKLIAPLSEKLVERKLIKSWFFIRYADPETHLRIRFNVPDLQNIGVVINLFQNVISEYVQNGLIWKVQTDTYFREIERYGNNSIELSEQLFYYDSVNIINMISMIAGDEGEEIRWQYGIRAVDDLLSRFNYSIEQKMHLMKMLKTAFSLEFRMNKELKMQIDKKFRTHRNMITELITKKTETINIFKTLCQLIDEKGVSIKPIVSTILVLNDKDELQVPLNNLLADYVHMLLNRLIPSRQRFHEMVIYDLMWRTYRSEIAKQKNLVKQCALG